MPSPPRDHPVEVTRRRAPPPAPGGLAAPPGGYLPVSRMRWRLHRSGGPPTEAGAAPTSLVPRHRFGDEPAAAGPSRRWPAGAHWEWRHEEVLDGIRATRTDSRLPRRAGPGGFRRRDRTGVPPGTSGGDQPRAKRRPEPPRPERRRLGDRRLGRDRALRGTRLRLQRRRLGLLALDPLARLARAGARRGRSGRRHGVRAPRGESRQGPGPRAAVAVGPR